jgi:hypothetical protein
MAVNYCGIATYTPKICAGAGRSKSGVLHRLSTEKTCTGGMRSGVRYPATLMGSRALRTTMSCLI